MDNLVKVMKIDSLIEEEVEILANMQEIVVFNVSPKKLEIDKEYKAEIDIFTNDFLDIKEQGNAKVKKIEQIDNFRYRIWGGLLEDNVLDVGFFITSDLLEDYKYLTGQYIFLEVDRLQLYCE